MARSAPKAHKEDCACCVEKAEQLARIRADLKKWKPGLWAELVGYGPTCSCNLAGNKVGCVKHFGPTDEPFDMRT